MQSTANGWNPLRCAGCQGACVCGPDSTNGFLLSEALRHFFAWLISIIPPLSVLCAGETAVTRHLKIAVGIVFTQPFPCVTKPFVAIGFRLLGEPRDLIPAPH